jgi:hypothetical protein
MAEFCKECSIKMWGNDTRDLADIVSQGDVAFVLCEGCGYCWVDENGKRVFPEADESA